MIQNLSTFVKGESSFEDLVEPAILPLSGTVGKANSPRQCIQCSDTGA